MGFEGLTPVADVNVGAWIAPRLCASCGRVCSVVPTGFAGYARVLHPAVDEHGDPVSWVEVARRTGSTPHPLMQWRSISRGWAGDDPGEGRLPAPELAALLDVLTGFTADGNDCYHAAWEGWGWLSPGGALVLYAERRWPWRPHRAMPPWYADGRWPRRRMWRSRRAKPGLAPRLAMPEDAAAQTRLRHPGRDYLLFRGPLYAAANIGDRLTGRFDLQGPSLLWPADRSWCVATEIDFDSTLVAGSVELITAVLQAPGLEAWPVAMDDDLTRNGDQLNP